MDDPLASPTAELCYRRATTQDVEAIVALTESAYRGDASRVGWTTEADLLDGRRTGPDEIQALVERSDVQLLLAFAGLRLVASAKLEARGEIAYFGMFSVEPQTQGKGYGRKVLAQAEAIAKSELHASEVHMEVIVQRQELIAWYERRGYERTGVYSPFPYGDERFGVPKRDDLRFELLRKEL